MHSIVTDIDATGLSVRAQDGTVTRHEAGTVLWTAGVAAPPVAAAIAAATGAKQDRAGRIMVGGDCTIPDHPEIFVTGDVMSLNKLPGVCEVAMQTGIYAGERIKHEVTGHMPTKPFRYHDLGSAAYLSRGNAVVSVGRLKFAGFLAWVVWLVIHIGFLTGFRNRLGAVVSWWPAFIRDVRRERTYTTEQVGLIHSAYDVLSPSIAGTALPGSTTGAELPSAGAKQEGRVSFDDDQPVDAVADRDHPGHEQHPDEYLVPVGTQPGVESRQATCRYARRDQMQQKGQPHQSRIDHHDDNQGYGAFLIADICGGDHLNCGDERDAGCEQEQADRKRAGRGRVGDHPRHEPLLWLLGIRHLRLPLGEHGARGEDQDAEAKP